MSAIYKEHSLTLDTKRITINALQNIVSGESGNKVTITLTDNGTTVSLTGLRVVLRVDSNLGTRRQDSSVSGDGVTISNGKAVIVLSPDTFTSGLCKCVLEVYSDVMICSAEFQFTAASSDDVEVNEWRRGSTPTHAFLPGIDLTDATISVTYEQNGKVVVTKTTSDMTVTSSSVTWTLTQADTLAMQVGSVDIQLHYTKNGVSDSSDIHKGKVLYTAGV